MTSRGTTDRLLGALLGGVLSQARPRRRRRAQPSGFGGGLIGALGGPRATASALAALAGMVAQALETAPLATPPAPPTPTPRPPQGAPWRRQPPPTPVIPPEPPQAGAEDAEALLLIRAMIAAARADGAIDPAERDAIAGQLDQADLPPASRDLVLAEFAAPISLEALCDAVRDPVFAAQVYAVSALAVGDPSQAERDWLATLSQRLALTPATIAAIHARLGA